MEDRPPPSSGTLDPNRDVQENHTSGDTQPPRIKKQVSFRARRPTLNDQNPTRTSLEIKSTPRNGDEEQLPHKRIDMLKDETGNLSEQSPLLGPTRKGQDVAKLPPRQGALGPSEDGWGPEDDDSQETKSSFYLFVLTMAIGG